jgi:zinc transporter 1
MYGHPAAIRASVVQTANDIALAQSLSPLQGGQVPPSVDFPLDADDSYHGGRPINVSGTLELKNAVLTPVAASSEWHPPSADHSQDSSAKHSHSTDAGSMNMRALVLHVLSDALGNVGVIIAGLVIWRTSWHARFYFDPIISLIIAIIICSSALPLGMILAYFHIFYLLITNFLSPQRCFYSPARGASFNIA